MSHTLCLGLVGLTRAVEWVSFAFGRRAPRGYEAGSLGVSLYAVTRTLYVAHALPRARRPHARCRRGGKDLSGVYISPEARRLFTYSIVVKSSFGRRAL